MNVKLKVKKLKSGRLSFFLQYYHPETRKRFKEYLGLYLIEKPKDEFERQHNKDTKDLAQKIHSKKLLEFQEGRFGFKSKVKNDILFLSYFESIMEKKKKSASLSNYSTWRSSLNQIKKFTRGSLKLSQIDTKYLNDLKDYLIIEKIGRGNRKISQNSAVTYFNKVLATLKEAYNEGIIIDNPGRRIKRIPVEETHREFLTEEEIQSLFNTDCRDCRIKM